MALDQCQTRLACGTALDALVDQVTEQEHPLDGAHQAACAHCQAALVALREAWDELQSFAGQPVVVPAGLSRRIMARIRALVSRWPSAAVLDGGRGETRISEWVLAQVAHRTALAVPGVVLASALSVIIDPADRTRVSCSLRLAITYGPAIDALTSAVREQVSQRVGAQTGVSVTRVDIAVADLLSGA